MNSQALRKSSVLAAARDPRVAELRGVLGEDCGICSLVGGAVRDYALGRSPLELDVLVEGDAAALVKRFGAVDSEFHDRFLTATVRFGFGEVDFASARTEAYPSAGALPVVSAGSLSEDRERRDFTLNCLRLRLDDLEPVEDEIGWTDLAEGRLRVLHSNSFIDDPTRLWRLARYWGRFGFEPEPETATLAAEAVANGAMKTISMHRHGGELLRTISSSEPDEGILRSVELGLVGPGLDAGALKAGLDELAAVAPSDVSPSELRLAALASLTPGLFAGRWPEAELGAGLTKVALDTELRGNLVTLLRERPSRSKVDSACTGLAPAAVLLAGLEAETPAASVWIVEDADRVLPISGQDLMDAGVAEGPLIGAGLAAARAAMLDEGITSPSDLIGIGLNAASGGGHDRRD